MVLYEVYLARVAVVLVLALLAEVHFVHQTVKFSLFILVVAWYLGSIRTPVLLCLHLLHRYFRYRIGLALSYGWLYLVIWLFHLDILLKFYLPDVLQLDLGRNVFLSDLLF